MNENKITIEDFIKIIEHNIPSFKQNMKNLWPDASVESKTFSEWFEMYVKWNSH